MLTARERECLQLICARLDRDGVAPSFAEMMAGLGLASKSGVHRLISGLEDKGYIRRLRGRERAIDVLKRPEGRVEIAEQAGFPQGRLAMAEKLIAHFLDATDPGERLGLAAFMDAEFDPAGSPGMTLRDVRTASMVFVRRGPVAQTAGAIGLARVKRCGQGVVR